MIVELDYTSNGDNLNTKLLAGGSIVVVVVLIAAFFVLQGGEDDPTEPELGSETLLTVLGNADLDNDIDNDDLEAIEIAVENGYSVREYPYSDANNDGVINQDDIDFIKRMIAKEDMTIYYYNVDGNVASVTYPIDGTIIAAYNKTVEAIRVLGLSDKLIATDDFTFTWPTYFPEFMGIDTIGSRFSPDVETILKLNPQAYLTGTTQWFAPTLEQDLGNSGIQVIRLPTWEQGQVLSGMVTLGYLTQTEEAAAKYLDWAQGILDTIEQRTSELSKSELASVLVLDANNYLSTKKEGSGQYENSIAAGGDNIMTGVTKTDAYYTNLTMEYILYRNPDFIIFSQGSTCYDWTNQDLQNKLDELGEAFALSGAYTSGNFHILNLEIFIGPSYPISVLYMAKWFYPDLFEDMDPEELLQEYYDEFNNSVIDVSTHGGFSA